jgi:hypothetical protein
VAHGGRRSRRWSSGSPTRGFLGGRRAHRRRISPSVASSTPGARLGISLLPYGKVEARAPMVSVRRVLLPGRPPMLRRLPSAAVLMFPPPRGLRLRRLPHLLPPAAGSCSAPPRGLRRGGLPSRRRRRRHPSRLPPPSLGWRESRKLLSQR